ncbi:hypothetical protein [Micromonospora sp. NPDC005173]|uniref:hypothetical protein n=1 Tax=Micromonospora sp. NPDC005173 TaxID=3157165 RepID=UPI0033BB4511
MDDLTEMLKGTLEGCVLEIIGGERHPRPPTTAAAVNVNMRSERVEPQPAVDRDTSGDVTEAA